MAQVVAAIVADPMAQHSLEDLAAIAHFSPFHFHRIYRSIMGETVAETVRRLRLAHAATLLGQNRRSVTEIALEVRYDSPQAFTRAFRNFTGKSPREFQRNIRQFGLQDENALRAENGPRPAIQLLERGPLRVHALRHRGPPATIPHVHRHLRQHVADKPITQWLGISVGDPDAGAGFSYYAAVALLDDQPIADDVELIEIPGGSYASYALLGPYTQINATITTLYSAWLPHSGYEPDDRPVLECYRNNPRSVAPDALRTDLLIPIRPIST